MSIQLMELYNDKIIMYSAKGKVEFKWDDTTIIENVNPTETVYINYYEEIMYHKNLILSAFEKENIEYKIINENELVVYKYINDIWLSNKQEVMGINQEKAYYVLRIDSGLLRITSFIVNNQRDQVHITMLEDEFIEISQKTESYYLILDLVAQIEKMSTNKRLIGKEMGKMIVLGREIYVNKIEKKFRERYEENTICRANQNIYQALILYTKVKGGNIKDPFNKYEIKYSDIEANLVDEEYTVNHEYY